MLNKNNIIGINKNLKIKNINVGDIILIEYETFGGYWNIKKFIGICIAKKNKGINTRITLRNVIDNVAIEYSFFLYSIDNIQIKKIFIQKKYNIRKSKLYYLRKKNLNYSKYVY